MGKRPRAASCFALVFPLPAESAHSPPPLGPWPGLLGRMTFWKRTASPRGAEGKTRGAGVCHARRRPAPSSPAGLAALPASEAAPTWALARSLAESAPPPHPQNGPGTEALTHARGSGRGGAGLDSCHPAGSGSGESHPKAGLPNPPSCSNSNGGLAAVTSGELASACRHFPGSLAPP